MIKLGLGHEYSVTYRQSLYEKEVKTIPKEVVEWTKFDSEFDSRINMAP